VLTDERRPRRPTAGAARASHRRLTPWDRTAGGPANAHRYHRRRRRIVRVALSGHFASGRPKRRHAGMLQRPRPKPVHRYPVRARVAQRAAATINRSSRREFLCPCLAHHRHLPLVVSHQSWRESAPAASGLTRPLLLAIATAGGGRNIRCRGHHPFHVRRTARTQLEIVGVVSQLAPPLGPWSQLVDRAWIATATGAAPSRTLL
jgi:hypothetical protein